MNNDSNNDRKIQVLLQAIKNDLVMDINGEHCDYFLHAAGITLAIGLLADDDAYQQAAALLDAHSAKLDECR